MIFEIDHYSLLLAQEGPPAPSDSNAVTGQPADPGGAGGANGPAGSTSPFGNSFLFLMIPAILMLIVFSMMGQRRDRKKKDAMLSAIKKHDRVQTIGGVLGSVVDVKPDTVVLKVDESSNTRITFARSSIQQVISSGKNGDDE